MAKKILVVDDEPNIVKIISTRLATEGYEVSSAEDGMGALNKARTEKPDLIILDIMLPKMDGFKVCSFLKRDQRYKHIPIILFTARVQDEGERHGREAGADAYFTKPTDSKAILAKVSELLNNANSATA